MEPIVALKEEGNVQYNLGCKNNGENQAALKNACMKYGAAIEQLIAYEAENQDEDAILNLKLSLFSNLAAANLKLDNIDGSRRCCNVVILFCNKPFLTLEDMGLDDDVTEDIVLIEPVLPCVHSILSKTLFRRGKCLEYLGFYEKAKIDFRSALQYVNGDKKWTNEIQNALSSCDHILRSRERQYEQTTKQSGCETAVDNNYSEDQASTPTVKNVKSVTNTSIVTVNGGPCLLRKGLWSQTTSETVVHLPVSFISSLAQHSQPSAVSNNKANKITYKVEFHINEVRIYGNSEMLLQEYLEYHIIPKDCVWMLENYSQPQQLPQLQPQQQHPQDSEQYLVLYLNKAKSAEWFPGCEWWDRVFVGDECIDTLTCTVNTDSRQLPVEARERAEREHHRFSGLSKQEQELELNHLQKMKEDFLSAELSSRAAADTEDGAIAQVPERAEMLNNLRQEFPHIDFAAK